MPRLLLILLLLAMLPRAHAQRASPASLNVGDISFDPALDGAVVLLAVAIIPATVNAQYNCTILKDSSEARACRLYNTSDSFVQGSPKCEQYLDSAIAGCPRFVGGVVSSSFAIIAVH